MIQNEAASWVAEYGIRKRFAKLGYISDFNDLDEKKAMIFAFIDAEIGDLQEKERKKKRIK